MIAETISASSASSTAPAESRTFRSRSSRERNVADTLSFEFASDPDLLRQYHRIYESEFNALFDTQYCHAGNDPHDRSGYTLIVKSAGECVGGARLSVKTPERPDLLPIEMGSFRVETFFPQTERFGQVGRLCLLPEFRGGAVTKRIMWHIHRQSLSLGLELIVGTAPLLTARSYVRGLSTLGATQTRIHLDIELPRYPMCEDVVFYLLSIVVPNTTLAELS